MTIKQVEERIQAIRDSAGDYEAAHGLEDKLYHDFIAYVASPKARHGDPTLGKKAELVLTTKLIDFVRYCA